MGWTRLRAGSAHSWQKFLWRSCRRRIRSGRRG